MVKHTGALVKKLIGITAGILSLTLLPSTAGAVPIAGDLSLSGGVKVTGTDIDWLPLSGTTDNEFVVIPSTAGDYFDYLLLTQGDAIDLNVAAQPVGVPIVLPNFLTFEADPGLSFELNFIAPCNPADCFIPNSPFNAYQQTIGGITRTTIELAMRGQVTDSTPNVPGPDVTNFWTGTYSADFNTTIANLQTQFLTQGFIQAPYSARLDVTFVPEPMTLLTFGTGTVLLAAHRRRRAKQKKQ